MAMIGAGSLGSLFVSIGTDLTDLDKGLKKAVNDIQRGSDQMSSAIDKTGKAFLKFGLIVTAGFGLAVKAAADFESAFAGVRKTVTASEAEFSQLEKNLKNMSKEIPISANELAKLMEIAGQLGIDGVENLTKFTKTIALLGQTTNISGESAALQLSRFINILGESQDNIDRIGSSIVALGNNFAAQESEILDLSLSLAAFGSQVGFRASQVLAFATVIKASGGEAQAAGTAFQKLALTLKDAVITGNRDLTDFANIAGVSAKEFKKLFQEDASEAIVVFLEGLRKIDEEGGSVTAALDTIGLADVRLVREISKVLKSTDDLRGALVLSADEFEKNTALTEEAEKRFKTFASQMKVLYNRLVDVAVQIGDVLIPILIKALDKIKPIIEKILEWVKGHKSLTEQIIITIAKLGLLAIAIGPVLIGIGKLIKTFTFLKVLLLTGVIPAFTTLSAFRFAGLLASVGVLAKNVGFLYPAALIVGSAFAGWKAGEWIDKATGVGKAFEWLGDKIFGVNEQLAENERLLALNQEAAGRNADLGMIVIDKPMNELVPPAGEGGGDEQPSILDRLDQITQFKDTFLSAKDEIAAGFKDALTKIEENMITLKSAVTDIVLTFQKGLGKAFSDIIMGTKSAKEAFTELGKSMIQTIVDIFAEWLAQQLVVRGLNLVMAGAAKVMAAGLAVAWAPAAFAASVATLGGAVATGTAALITGLDRAVGLITAASGASAGLAEGTDTVPAMLSPGEMVVPRSFADAIRQGDLTLSGGGTGEPRQGGGSVNNITIIMNAEIANDIDIDRLTEAIGLNIEEKLRVA